MARYKVTTELKTPLWKRVLRWFRLYSKMKTFEILFEGDYYSVGEVLFGGDNQIKIIEKL